MQFKMAKKMKQVEAFSCDPDFCPRCGSILPLPGLTDVVSCSLCDFKKNTAGKSLKNSFTKWGNISLHQIYTSVMFIVECKGV